MNDLWETHKGCHTKQHQLLLWQIKPGLRPGPKIIKLFSSSAESKIYPAHKC